jgi:hypothetical protein
MIFNPWTPIVNTTKANIDSLFKELLKLKQIDLIDPLFGLLITV